MAAVMAFLMSALGGVAPLPFHRAMRRVGTAADKGVTLSSLRAHSELRLV